MAQVEPLDAELSDNESISRAMSEPHPINQVTPAERHALAEWQSLLTRLNATDARLRRVRHAIASGEFQVDARAIAERLISRLLSS